MAAINKPPNTYTILVVYNIHGGGNDGFSDTSIFQLQRFAVWFFTFRAEKSRANSTSGVYSIKPFRCQWRPSLHNSFAFLGNSPTTLSFHWITANCNLTTFYVFVPLYFDVKWRVVRLLTKESCARREEDGCQSEISAVANGWRVEKRSATQNHSNEVKYKCLDSVKCAVWKMRTNDTRHTVIRFAINSIRFGYSILHVYVHWRATYSWCVTQFRLAPECLKMVQLILH